jgi:hypothetical protein
MTDLKEIRARLDKASPGPWRALSGAKQRAYASMGYPTAAIPLILGNNEHVLGELSAWVDDGDRDLIVHARTDIEYLYEEIRACRHYLRSVLDGDPDAIEAARHYLSCVEAP